MLPSVRAARLRTAITSPVQEQARDESMRNRVREPVRSAPQAQLPEQAPGKPEHRRGRLGPFLCWAVVFADIGTSIYYVPGILYGRVGNLAGFFVLLTMSAFVLLTLKYAE